MGKRRIVGDDTGTVVAFREAVLPAARRRRSRRRRGALGAFFVATMAAASPESMARAEHVAAPPAKAHPTLVLGWDPLPLLAETVSLQVEVLPTAHVGIVGGAQFLSTTTVHGRTSDNNYTASSEAFGGFGAELGARLYPASMSFGSAAWFVGTSVFFGEYRWSTTYSGYGFAPAVDYTRIGFALDIGGSYVAPFGLAISGGAGFQFAKNLGGVPDYGVGGGPADGLINTLFYGSGARPRLLLSLGWAF
jgi:hypothetical protein